MNRAFTISIKGHQLRVPNINQHCYLCHQYSKQLVCLYCFDMLARSHLGQHTASMVDLLRHPRVLQNLQEPEYDHLFSIDNYSWPIDQLVLDMKFSHKSLAARALVDLFLHFVYQPFSNILYAEGSTPQLLIPVPLSLRRYWQRRYNQAQLLCNWLSAATGTPNEAVVARVKHTHPQTELSKDERLENVSNAFECSMVLPYTHVVIVDDVITTGVTINAVCLAIKRNNPNIRISVWTMAVTLLK